MAYANHYLFGVDTHSALKEWFDAQFVPSFHLRFPGEHFAGFLYHPDDVLVVDELRGREFFSFTTAYYVDAGMVTEGLWRNVYGKARFSIRTGLDSSEAATHRHLVRPGDFPYGGFIFRKGVPGGGSGLTEEQDAELIAEIIDAYIAICDEATNNVIRIIEWARKSWDHDIGNWKYLNGDPEMLEVYREAYATAMAA